MTVTDKKQKQNRSRSIEVAVATCRYPFIENKSNPRKFREAEVQDGRCSNLGLRQSRPAVVAACVNLQASALSWELAPLRSADEVAELARSMAAVPPGTPGRARRLLDTLSLAARTNAPSIAALVQRLEITAPGFMRLVASALTYVHGDTIVLVPPVSESLRAESSLSIGRKCSATNIGASPLASRKTVAANR